MVLYASVRDIGVDLCARAGYDVDADPGPGHPPALADPTADAVGLVDDPRPIAIEPLTEASVGPEAVVPRLAAALDAGQDCLFVAPAPDGSEALARVVASVLETPTALAADDPEGRRFYSGPDRVPLSDGTYACVRAPPERLQWREVRVGADRPRLELSAADEVVAVFEHVDALACPDRGTFRHAYARTDDGQFAVTERGEVVATFAGVAAMRRGGYTPVAMPLVPEHLFPAESTPARSWAVCAATDDPAVYGPDGVHDWP
ncbi:MULTISPECIES: hypothetical protein [Salinibaculum]|uniref:hypothetical protein n=1 Tax=Salinibaculum TaxID=2732368 RepID=UPI0030D423A1